MLVKKEITNMTSQMITKIEQQMLTHLDNRQMKQLHAVLMSCLQEPCEQTNVDHIQLFLAAKRVEGCSEKTIRYYASTLRNAFSSVKKDVLQITTDDLRLYLDEYQSSGEAGKTTIDNIRRILSSFFAWLEDEDYIIKSPVRRIHKVKTCKTVKETYSDEALEIMRDHCETARDLALIDFLASTGMRVGELVLLNRDDIDFTNRECVVLGKATSSERYISMLEQRFTCRITCTRGQIITLHFLCRFRSHIIVCRFAVSKSASMSLVRN